MPPFSCLLCSCVSSQECSAAVEPALCDAPGIDTFESNLQRIGSGEAEADEAQQAVLGQTAMEHIQRLRSACTAPLTTAALLNAVTLDTSVLLSPDYKAAPYQSCNARHGSRHCNHK